MTKLSKAERLLLDFITEFMDEDNIIHNNAITRDNFNKLLKRISFPEYSQSTLNKCFSGLAKHHLIYKTKGKRGAYKVEPLYFFKGSQEDRVKMVRDKVEELNKIPINKHRHKLLSNKKNPRT
jgi:hypothetical protein